MFVEYKDEILHFLWQIQMLPWFPGYLEQEEEEEEKTMKVNMKLTIDGKLNSWRQKTLE